MSKMNVSKAYHKHTTIKAANPRDLSYIAANMRQADRVEIDCQLPEWTPTGLAYMHLSGRSWTALW